MHHRARQGAYSDAVHWIQMSTREGSCAHVPVTYNRQPFRQKVALVQVEGRGTVGPPLCSLSLS